MMKVNINIEFNGSLAEIKQDMKIFNLLSADPEAVLDAAKATATKTVATKAAKLNPEVEAATPKPQKAVPVTAAVPQAAPATPAPAAEPVMPAQEKAQSAAQAAAPVTAVPTSPAKEYTLDELLTATAPLMDAGKVAELQALMQKYGVVSMMEIPQEKYGDLATDLRAMGARL